MGRIENDGAIAVGAVRIADNASLADGELIVIGDKTYEWNDTEGDIADGNVWLDRTAGSDAACATELKNKINANVPTIPVNAYIDPIDTKVVRIEAEGLASRGNMAFTTTMLDAQNIIAASDDDTLSHGADAENKHDRRGSYEVTALDVLAQSFMIPTGLQAPTNMQIDCWSALGLQKTLTTLCTFDSEGRIKGDYDGATNPAASDVVNWSAW